MSDTALAALAEEAGIATRWRDFRGGMHEVAPPTQRAVLAALGFPAGSDAEIRDGMKRIRAIREGAELPPLIAVDAGQSFELPVAAGRFQVRSEDGTSREALAEDANGRAKLPAVDVPGYHELEIGEHRTTLAVAPARSFSVRDGGVATRPWGLAVQLYSLRREGDGGIGDFAALRRFVRSAAEHGAAAVAISPVHAQFSADPDRFSPYAPSSRLALNVLHADPGALELPASGEDACKAESDRLESLPLIDWPAAARLRLARFKRLYKSLGSASHPLITEFAEFRAVRPDLVAHARFEALHGAMFGADRSRWHWRSWPDELRDPRNRAVEAFAAEHEEEVGFHLFMQFIAERQLEAAQAEARSAGMRFGLISDLAVGTDSGGSQGWSRQEEMLNGLTIGAPPDLLNVRGQNWGVVAFSPTGLVRNGYSAFLDMLRAALRHAGGVRMDHAMGLRRLWVVPEGADAKEGAYLRFPQDDMLRLIALESHRHRAIVLGEDLGTVPEGFRDQLEARGIMGMRVLWFERKDDGFDPPSTWSRAAVAMTSTHDLPTVGGWWSGRDLEWRRDLHLLGDEAAVRSEYETRERDRALLWQAFCASGAASGEAPPAAEPAAAIDAAVRHVGCAQCDMAVLPLEDAVGQQEQPNLPGTTAEHPNWRRRMPATVDRLLEQPDVAQRLAQLAQARAP